MKPMIHTEGTDMKIFLVQAFGVSLICEQGESMLGWISYILDRGGIPTITPLKEVI